jgi:2-polyprenyl-6-hydroxyphenyl methylase/3-demethylubiquinone-9 3-methyltransferase
MCEKDENYYASNLNSQKLYKVYDTNIPRVRQYLDMEIEFVRNRLNGAEKVLELGVGYGRILKELYSCTKYFLGIDISSDSVEFGKEYLKEFPHIRLETMDAHELIFENEYVAVLCLQNGLSALSGEAINLVKRCMKALKRSGAAYFSTYSGKFWEHRLAWFEEQADKGLLGAIDKTQTGNGVIVCQDGFRAVTFTENDFIELGESSGCNYEIQEVDESSLFLIITKT